MERYIYKWDILFPGILRLFPNYSLPFKSTQAFPSLLSLQGFTFIFLFYYTISQGKKKYDIYLYAYLLIDLFIHSKNPLII